MRIKMLFALMLTIGLGLTSSRDTTAAFQQSSYWPTFRGQAGSGVADGFELPMVWNADENAGELSGVLWQTDVPGLGHSSPIVVGDRIYLATAIAIDGNSPLVIKSGGSPTAADDNGEQSWVILCYDRNSGEELWRQTAKKGRPRATRHAKATHANTSLAVDGDNLVAFFGSEGLYCYDLDGKLKWEKDLGVINISKYGIGWGYANSPAVANDRVVLVCDDPENPFVVALNLVSGNEVWRVSRKGDCERSWASPLIHESDDRIQIVVNGYPWIVSYDLTSGKELWRIKGGGDNPVPTPFIADGLIYITNAHGGAAPIYVVRPEASGDISTAKGATANDAVVWSSGNGGCYLSTPVVYEDHLYLGNTNGVVRSFHAKSGKPGFQERLDSNAGVIASLVAGDNKIYCASENGTVYVLAAGEEFKVLSRNAMGAPCLATPAISQGVMYIRTTEKLVAISNKADPKFLRADLQVPDRIAKNAKPPSLDEESSKLSPTRTTTYKKAGGVELKLHVFEPAGHQPTASVPAIVFFFGGSWNTGSPTQFYDQADYFASKGMVTFSAEYRVKSRNKTTPYDAVEDAKSAVRWIRQHAGELGVDPNRIVASGGSAGGHIAGCTGLIDGFEGKGEDHTIGSVPNAMILFNPVLDTTEKGYGAARFEPDKRTELSPCQHVRSGIAPTLLLHGTKDSTVPFENAERFARLMNEAGNRCDLKPYKEKGHGFFNGPHFRPTIKDSTDYDQTIRDCEAFLSSLGYLQLGG